MPAASWMPAARGAGNTAAGAAAARAAVPCTAGRRPSRARSQCRRQRAAGGPAGEQAAAEERALQRPVAVHAPPAETGDLPGGVQAGERLTVGAQHPGLEVGLQAAEGLAGEQVEPDGD